MAPLPSLVALASLLVVHTLAVPYGIQTMDSKSSYGGSIHYDSENDVIHMTGSTYGSFWNTVFNDDETSAESKCFYGILQLPPESGDAIMPPSWLYKTKIGNPGVLEACSTLAVKTNKTYLGGWSEPDGLLDEMISNGGTRSMQYGVIFDMNVALKMPGAPLPTTTEIVGGKLIHNTRGPQLTSSLAMSNSGDFLYMASLESDDEEDTEDTDNTDQPNYSTGGVIKRGSDFYINIEKLDTVIEASNTETLKRVWGRQIATTVGIENVAGLLVFSDDLLVLAGSAVGSDDAIPKNDNVGTDSDGFVSFFSTADNAVTGGLRIQSQTGKNDYIYDICMNPGEDFIYLAGSTKGSFSTDPNIKENTQAFLVKVNPGNQSVVWIRPMTAQLETELGDVEGLSCAVTPDGLHVYLGGIVKNSATIASHSSQGRDDFAFAQFLNDGTLTWTEQFGTRGNEYLSDTDTDKNGNLLIMGNTDGSFFRERTQGGSTDIVVFAVSRENGAGPTNVDLKQPINTDPTPIPDNTVPAATPAPTVVVSGLAAPEDPAPKKSNSVVVMTLLAVALIIIVGLLLWQRSRNKESYPDSAQVLEYLRGFDDVEVDLRHSASGGYHGTYVNHDGGPRYYKGDTDRASFRGNEMSPLTYDPIVEESLFSIDDDEPGSFGGSGVGALKRQVSNYDGLMDAYNMAWGDLSQHQLPTNSTYTPSQRMTSSRGSLSARAILEDDVFQEVDIRGDKSNSPAIKVARTKARSMRWGHEIV